jgi:uncharacterized membrane protein
VVSVLSLVSFQKDYVLQKDVLGWCVVLGLAVVDLIAVSAKVIKGRSVGKGPNGLLVMAVMCLSLPILLIASRISALLKEEISWNLGLFDFLAGAGVTIFFGLLCGPVVSESNDYGGDHGKSMSGFTAGF